MVSKINNFYILYIKKMQKDYSTKEVKETKTKEIKEEVVLRKFSFPREGITIEAETLEEAKEKLLLLK